MSGLARPGLPPGRTDIGAFEGEIRSNPVDQEREMQPRHVKLDIINTSDEAESTVAAPLGRTKSGNCPANTFLDNGHDEEQPLVQEAPTIRIDVSEQVAVVPPERQHSFREDVGQAARETCLCSRLCLSLLRSFGIGCQVITKVLALWLYAMCLMPGFVQVGYQYFFSKNIHRSIVYGSQRRNRLDLYAPEDLSSPKQVVVFVTGGAWIIGYRAWGALLGLQLSERDVMVCCVDYRNFPRGKISDMVDDVSTCIGFIVNNIGRFGGDPDRIYLAGQSAGSHIAACALLQQAQIEIGKKEGIMTWKTSQLKAFLGISGGYNLPSLVDHFHERGLYRKVFFRIMEGETSLPLYSPELTVQREEYSPAVPLLPPIYLFHGTGDYSIPFQASENFGNVLERVGATAATKLYSDKTHTDVILQDPMRGGHDALFDDFLGVLHADDEESKASDAKAPLRPRLVPECLLYLAHVVSPF